MEHKNITLDKLFTPTEMKNLEKHKEVFNTLVSYLGRIAEITQTFPTSFKINSTQYSNFWKKELSENVKQLQKEFKQYVPSYSY